ncbi:MAG: aldo/keto reductase [Oscillospiraceae bacterium]|nr:aldo/keto reductase [Oscillospiraceae bacterium]
MEYVRFGKTQETVSRIGFGGATAGLRNYLGEFDPDNPATRKTIYTALEAALENGINYFDTAPAYGEGASEEMFGEVLGSVPKDKIFLATKCGPTDYDGVMRSIEQSLKRLKRDSIDLLQIHGSGYSRETARDILSHGGMLEAMEQLKKDGVVRFIGFTSEDNNAAVYDFMESGRFDTVQLCYNFIYQHPYDPSRSHGSLCEAKKLDIGTVCMRAATSGIFQKWMRMVRPDDDFDYTEALIRFTLSNPLINVVLIGMRSVGEVMRNIALEADKSARFDLDELHERYI